MVFEAIKAHFVQKQQEEQKWFIVEFRKDKKTIHIVEQKIVEIMLADSDDDLLRLILCGYVANVGWHQGNDNKIYERHVLTQKGKELYNSQGISYVAPNYLKALEEMNNSPINPLEVTDEKAEIWWNFRKNQIKSIQIYEGKELEKEEEIKSNLNR